MDDITNILMHISGVNYKEEKIIVYGENDIDPETKVITPSLPFNKIEERIDEVVEKIIEKIKEKK